MSKPYYYDRKHDITREYTLSDLIIDYTNIMDEYCKNGYFIEEFGYQCVDGNDYGGTLNTYGDTDKINHIIKKETGLEYIWPLKESYNNISEEGLFTLIEFFYEYISFPKHLKYHSWNNCGLHITGLTTFDKKKGQQEYIVEINNLLNKYKNNILDDSGLIIDQTNHVDYLIQETKSVIDSNNNIDRAVKKFFHYNSSIEDKKESIRTLSDELELLKSKDIRLYTKDESDLFQIINRFDIRHKNVSQKSNYENDCFYEWMFFTFLASINLLNDLHKRK